MRSYDLVVRVGGDESVCAFGNMTPQAAADGVEVVLRKGHVTCLDQCGPRAFTTRADAELYRIKKMKFSPASCPKARGGAA